MLFVHDEIPRFRSVWQDKTSMWLIYDSPIGYIQLQWSSFSRFLKTLNIHQSWVSYQSNALFMRKPMARLLWCFCIDWQFSLLSIVKLLQLLHTLPFWVKMSWNVLWLVSPTQCVRDIIKPRRFITNAWNFTNIYATTITAWPAVRMIQWEVSTGSFLLIACPNLACISPETLLWHMNTKSLLSAQLGIDQWPATQMSLWTLKAGVACVVILITHLVATCVHSALSLVDQSLYASQCSFFW